MRPFVVSLIVSLFLLLLAPQMADHQQPARVEPADDSPGGVAAPSEVRRLENMLVAARSDPCERNPLWAHWLDPAPAWVAAGSTRAAAPRPQQQTGETLWAERPMTSETGSELVARTIRLPDRSSGPRTDAGARPAGQRPAPPGTA